MPVCMRKKETAFYSCWATENVLAEHNSPDKGKGASEQRTQFFFTTKLLVAARTIGTVATEFTIFLPLLRMKIDEMNKVTKW